MKRNYITIGILIILVGVFAISRAGHTGYSATNTAISSASAGTTTEAVASKPAVVQASASKTSTQPAPATQSPANNVTLVADGKPYQGHITGDESVLMLMRALVSTSGFVFTGEEYPSLGYFVDSIDGKKNGDGYYWILYIDGKSSDLGASSATIKPGDTVEWRFEKSY